VKALAQCEWCKMKRGGLHFRKVNIADYLERWYKRVQERDAEYRDISGQALNDLHSISCLLG
jgi:hypothetical protein